MTSAVAVVVIHPAWVLFFSIINYLLDYISRKLPTAVGVNSTLVLTLLFLLQILQTRYRLKIRKDQTVIFVRLIVFLKVNKQVSLQAFIAQIFMA